MRSVFYNCIQTQKTANHFNQFYLDKVNQIYQSIQETDTIEKAYYSKPFNGEKFNSFKPITEEN